MEIEPKIKGVSCVLVGSLNPAIFKPDWLGQTGLFRKADLKTIEFEVSEEKSAFFHPEMCAFSFSNIDVGIQLNRFAAQTNDETQFETLRDFVAGIFSILEHTPINSMGINIGGQFDLENKNTWDSLGHLLAPKEPWQDIFEGPLGLKSLTIQGENPYCERGYIRTTVQPSDPKTIEYGVHIETNNHFELTEKNNSLKAVKILNTQWKTIVEESFQRNGKIAGKSK